ncbi:MAG: 2-amino-4-hydroxy-6-hydroxymethyldihydropteridine diphosphokinase [bacterium]|nr:2-amino-4-hydroxy-6-hydroxymethyldihydropteridine diphosphokinase [bacterium]
MEGFIGLGSNLGRRSRYLRAGLEGLRRRGLEPLAESSVWETEPVEAPKGGWFWNMAIKIDDPRPPEEILAILLEVERDNGRVRAEPNGPRTLDLDLLLLGDREVDGPELQLPHPRMWGRRFVLEPLAEIAPDLKNPNTGRTVDQERRSVGGSAIVRKLGRLASC